MINAAGETTLLTFRTDEIAVAVVASNGQFELRWFDHVVNEETEIFDDLSSAVARFALLIHCGETDWEALFTSDPRDFAAAAKQFHHQHLTTHGSCTVDHSGDGA